MPTRSIRHSLLSRVLLCVWLLCMLAPAAFAQPLPPRAGDSRAAPADPRHSGHRLTQGPAAWPSIPSRPQGQVRMPSASAQPQGAAGAQGPLAATRIQSPTLDLKVLVIAADGTEPTLPAIQQALDYLGTPYTTWIATQHPNALTASVLFSTTHSFYQGVMLTTGSLNYSTDGGVTFKSALSAAEWQTLWDYEAAFGIRQATWYTFPTADYGFGAATPVDTTASPIAATLTPAGQTVFPYINATNPVTISNAYAYVAPTAGAGNTVLLTDASNHALALVHAYPDGRENLALTFDGNQYLVHTVALSNGVIDWVTRGLHLGELHTYIGAQVDDLFLADQVWTPDTPCGTDPELTSEIFRTEDVDIQAVVDWQLQVQAQPTTQQLKLDMAFNGSGALGEDVPVTDTLVPAIRDLKDNFKWISHTWDHLLLNSISYISATEEIVKNNAAAQVLGFNSYSTLNMVTPEISGLYNPEYLRAAHDQGIRFLVSDTSKPITNTTSPVRPNTGSYNFYQPSIFMIPRRPNNLFYNVSTPEQWVAEYNCIYATATITNPNPPFPLQTYDQILGRESDILLSYLLRGESYPWMFHQPNLRAYDGTNTLISDLLNLTLAKYNRIYNLPIQSPTMDDLGRHVADHTNYYNQTNATSKQTNAAAAHAGFIASVVPGRSITIQSTKAITVPVTGLHKSDAEHYGGHDIAHVSLAAGVSVTLSLATGEPMPPPLPPPPPPPPPPPLRHVYLPLVRKP
jgi:hypothetical protein